MEIVIAKYSRKTHIAKRIFPPSKFSLKKFDLTFLAAIIENIGMRETESHRQILAEDYYYYFFFYFKHFVIYKLNKLIHSFLFFQKISYVFVYDKIY